jgi:hypothetical protein
VRNEIGLSDGYAEALGEMIGLKSTQTGPNACGVMVVTHSRRLVRGLIRGLGAVPTFMTMSAGHDDVDAWLDAEETRSVDDLLALKDVGLERWRAIEKLLRR